MSVTHQLNQMNKNRAILIDAENRIIKEVEIGAGLEDIYKNIGCDLFTVAGNFNEDVNANLLDSLLVDDEGLLTPGKPIFSFNPPGWYMQTEFAGNGLITGVDYNNGETISCRIPLYDLATYVDWTNKLTN
jgi:hypothetical protein